jgi:hypothetical protein
MGDHLYHVETFDRAEGMGGAIFAFAESKAAAKKAVQAFVRATYERPLPDLGEVKMVRMQVFETDADGQLFGRP